METLNKNWFAFTLIAVIFGLLDFILVKQGAGSHYQSCPAMPMMNHGIMKILSSYANDAYETSRWG